MKPRSRLHLWTAFPVLLVLAGAFFPGPAAWGINHLAYLTPAWQWGITGLAVVLFSLALWNSRASRLPDKTAGYLLESGPGMVLTGLVLAALFWSIQVAHQFLGDGILLLDLLARKVPFRAFDTGDYLLHLQLAGWLEKAEGLGPAHAYRLSGTLAGVAAWALILAQTRRLRWDLRRRLVFLGLFFFSGPALFFFGYVESYSWLLVAMTGFVLGGQAYLEERGPLWAPSFFWSLGLFFHLTAIFSLPALAYLGWTAWSRQDPESRAKKLTSLFLPPMLAIALSLSLHLALGFDHSWFQNEYLSGTHTRGLLVSATGPEGLFSTYQGKMQLNLLLLVSPVSLVMLLLSARFLKTRWRQPLVIFLGVQILSVALASLLVQRKLGDAQDWDLLAAHFVGLPLLATHCWFGQDASRNRRSSAWPAVFALLVFLPWLALNAQENGSRERFSSVARGFPPFKQGYAFENLGRHHQKSGQLEAALAMYEQGAAACPSHARFQKLVGTTSLELFQGADPGSPEARTRLQQAATYLEKSLALDPDQNITRENLCRVYIKLERFDRAVHHYQILSRAHPERASVWAGLGFSQLKQAREKGEFAAAAGSLQEALQRDSRLNIYRYLALALEGSGNREAAHQAAREALSRKETGAAALERRLRPGN